MKKTTRTTAVGVFENREQAQRAVDELHRAGFTDAQIGVAGRETAASSKTTGSEETYAEEGAVTGALAGAGVGALWAIGIAAGVLPAIGPVIAGGTLAAMLASAALGATAAGIAGALVGMGIPEEEANYYESEFTAGRTIVTVKAENRYDEAVAILNRNHGYDMHTRTTTQTATSRTAAVAPAATSTTTAAGSKVRLHEEKLDVHKHDVETGEVRLRKEVHTEHKTINVPVTKEEVVIERHPVSGSASSSDIRAGEEIRIPVREEHVHVEKTPVVKEEVTVGKRKVQTTEQVSADVRSEEVRIEEEGEVDIKGNVKDKTKKKK